MTTAKSNKFRVQCASMDEDSIFPMCPHGPTLFFYKEIDLKNGYFACSAFRDKRDCNFKISLNELEKESKKLSQEPSKWNVSKQIAEYRKMRQKVLKSTKGKPVLYCHACNGVLLRKQANTHDDSHELVELTNKHLQDPTMLLKPAQNDKIQAQYFFDDKALKFFEKCLQELKITKVICMGAPRLHAYLLKNQENNIQSFLLDFDSRFFYFYDDTEFSWYNMCNNHFFDPSQKSRFLDFLKNDNGDERVLIFTDPPFGCRTESIAQTLRNLTYLHNEVNELPHQPLPIFWIFPYFMAQYIKQEMSEMQMSDYKVNYTNHAAYSNSGDKDNRKLGSPVRLFTNVPLSMITLPIGEGYKYCASCQYYTALENRHCKICNTCASINGSTYRHCDLCGHCVKPNYVHCNNCRRCTQVDGHSCNNYQSKQRCWICRKLGHTERSCKAWRNSAKAFMLTASTATMSLNDTRIHCLLCGNQGHNELKCPKRQLYIEEITFLGDTTIRFK